ncbi:MAG TPA: ABC transporter substrate-binding protein [Polyangiaceae bacterium]|nr:ABC transporter substrate-binding protein [Polyangiaceae bacterium]
MTDGALRLFARASLTRCALSVAVLLALGCSRSESKPASGRAASERFETLELRYQGNNGTVTPAELAEDLGYLAPLRLGFVGSTASGPASIQAVVTGDTDFGGAFNGAIVKLVAAKAPIVSVIGYYGVDEQRRSGFYVLDSSPIKTARDLLGKKVAMNTLGAHSEFMVKEFLFRAKLTSEDTRQVMLVAIPPVNAEQVLRQGQVDMASLSDIYRDRALETGGIRAVFSDHELFGAFTAGAYVMKKDFIRANPNTAKKFVEAIGRALEWSRKTPREQVIARMTAIIGKRARTENIAALKYWKSYGVAGAYGRLEDKDFQVWVDWMVRSGELKPGQIQMKDLYTNELNPNAYPRAAAGATP